MKRGLLKTIMLLMMCALSTAVFAQTGSVKGTVYDGDTEEALIGANVILKGTSKGTVTDVNGAFTLGDLPVGATTIVVSYIGYEDLELSARITDGGTVDLGKVNLSSSAVGLAEIEIIASVAIDRKTPVAVSNIKADAIEAKMGTQEFPEILKSTPGVYATKTGGGYGDGRINLRGFDSENVAVLINGVPVNDMENGRVYWSNWAGLTDATNSMQVQRGLGASKVAVPSVGGTINILSKASDAKSGGSFYLGHANSGYQKVGLVLSSGLTDEGWAFTVSASQTKGAMWVDGTEFVGYSYFANIAKIINKKHEINFTALGSKQRHGQRQNRLRISDYRDQSRGRQYNADWGYKKGQITHVEDNFYHKPQLSLNHYWTINNTTQLSTSAYASFGTGGGGGTAGETSKFSYALDQNSAYREGGLIDLDLIVEENKATSANGFGSESILRASRNDHKWYGILSTLDKDLNDDLKLLGGIDLRYYKGSHYREVTDLLGGHFFLDDSDENNPNAALQVGDKMSYHNDGVVLWEGVFGQLEYTKNKLAAFISLAASNTSYKRIDYFNYLDSDPNRETDYQNFFGYSVKGGANYNLTETHNVYANVGYFEKAPFFDAVFLNFQNDINEGVKNQKVVSYELGYGFRKSNFTANVNVYTTKWKDRTFTRTVQGVDGEDLTANILGVNATHSGIEFDGEYTVNGKMTIKGMLSIGDWKWQNDLKDVKIFDGQTEVGSVDLFIGGLKVGDAAQTTAAIGLDYELMKGLKFGLDYNYFDNLYADYDPLDRGNEDEKGVQSWKVPNYATFDVNMTYKFKVASLNTSLFANVYNLTDTEYISDANDGSLHNATDALVYYGFGRTYSVGMRIRF